MGGLRHARRGRGVIVALLGVLAMSSSRAAAGSRAAYFYHYMEPSHLDRLAASGFDTAVIHWNGDTLGVTGVRQLQAFVAKGQSVGLEVVPQWILQQPSRLSLAQPDRRYTWGRGTVEHSIPCPLDTTYWRSALLERADAMLAAAPRTRRAVDHLGDQRPVALIESSPLQHLGQHEVGVGAVAVDADEGVDGDGPGRGGATGHDPSRSPSTGRAPLRHAASMRSARLAFSSFGLSLGMTCS